MLIDLKGSTVSRGTNSTPWLGAKVRGHVTSISRLVIRASFTFFFGLRKYSIRLDNIILNFANALKYAQPTYFLTMDINDGLSPTSPEPRTRTLPYRKVTSRIG